MIAASQAWKHDAKHSRAAVVGSSFLPATSVARKAKWKPEGEMEGTKTAAESEAP